MWKFTRAFSTISRKLSSSSKKITHVSPYQNHSLAKRLTDRYFTNKLLRFAQIYRSASTGSALKAPPILTSTDDFTDFMSLFPEVLQNLIEDVNLDGLSEVADRFTKTLEYNVFGGKQNVSQMGLVAYKAFAAPEQLTRENLRKVHILGWCNELILASLIMTDDLMDNSEMRRGKLCWHRNTNIGLTALNDALMIECGAFALLRRHFHDHPLYMSLVEIYEDVRRKISIGQSLDVQCLRDGKPQLDLFTRTRYEVIVKYKTSFGANLPVTLAMALAGNEDPEMQAKVETVMMEMGEWYQIQDDFLDFAGTSEVMGKDVGNDIKDGKCSWLAVTALEKASPAQRVIMESCYGSEDPEHIQAIRELYLDLKLPHLFSAYDEEFYNRIRTQIKQYFSGKPQEMFFQTIDNLHRRNR